MMKPYAAGLDISHTKGTVVLQNIEMWSAILEIGSYLLGLDTNL